MSAEFSLVEQHPEGRYVARYHRGGVHGPFLSVEGPHLKGAAEYSARRGAAVDRQLEEAIRYTLEKIVRPQLEKSNAARP